MPPTNPQATSLNGTYNKNSKSVMDLVGVSRDVKEEGDV
jgi:hypothetical protein